jgi:hypothetical protein
MYYKSGKNRLINGTSKSAIQGAIEALRRKDSALGDQTDVPKAAFSP